MDRQRILNTSMAAVAIAFGVALLTVTVVVWILGAILPLSYGGVVEKLVFAVAAGGLAFGLRRLTRKAIVPRLFRPGPVERELLEEYHPHRGLVAGIWAAGLIFGMMCLFFPLELIREGSALATLAALAVLSREKPMVEYYLLKTEEW